LVLLPSTLREKHGVAMSELYVRQLERTEAHGQGAVWRVAVAGMADLIGRGVYERVVEERAALAGPNRQHLRDLVSAYAVALVALTTVMLSMYARNGWLWRMREIPIATAFESIMLAIPFISALTIPMAVFVAVLYTGTRAAANGPYRPPASTSFQRGAQLRLAPIIGIACLVALFGFAWNAEVVPRANGRLAALYAGEETALAPNDRSMTLSQLRMESRRVTQQSDVAPTANLRETAVRYSVEIHKKFALAAACVVLALLAAGIARRAPHGGLAVQVVAAAVVFSGYYISLMTGEALAERFVVSPATAMWSANIVALGLALLALQEGANSRQRKGALP